MASSRQQNDKKLGGFSRNFSTKCCFTSRNRLQPDSDIYNVSERGLTRKHLLVNVLLHWRHICICAGLLGLGLSSSPKSTLFICWLQNAGLGVLHAWKYFSCCYIFVGCQSTDWTVSVSEHAARTSSDKSATDREFVELRFWRISSRSHGKVCHLSFQLTCLI